MLRSAVVNFFSYFFEGLTLPRKGAWPPRGLTPPLTLVTLCSSNFCNVGSYFFEGLTLPGAALPGVCVLRSASMKTNWSGDAAHSNSML